ncbi:unnamed protein product [Ascophyllum nodosum]
MSAEQQQMAQLGADPAMLEQLLMEMFVPDTSQIKKAEALLKVYTREPACVPPLLQQMRSSQHEQARQLAAMLLKKKIMLHWKTFNEQEKESVKSMLLQAVGTDPSRLVRVAVASLISKLAKSLFAAEGWPELLDLVGQCAQQVQSEDHRELAFVILFELTETVGDVLTAHFDVLQGLFLQALKDPRQGEDKKSACPHAKVQVSALKACSALLAYLSMDDSGMKFRSLVQPCLQVAKGCLLRGDDTTVSVTLEVFADLCSSPLSLVNAHADELVDFLLHILGDANAEMNLKDSSALVLTQLAEAKPKVLAKTGKVPIILRVLMNLIAEYKGSAANALFNYQALDEDEDDDEEDDGPNSQSIAQACLDALALHLPTKHTFGPLMDLCNSFLGNPEPHVRKAAVAALGVMSEGCAEPIKARLAEILPKILELALDHSPHVRECSCFCLGQFAEHCQPEILDHSEEVLPIVFRLLDDATDNVKGVSCYVLEMFTENLEPETVMPFLKPLMTRLVEMLHTPKRGVKEMSVAAIAATAVSAGENFLPYMAATCSMLGPFMTLQDDKMLNLRGRALECMGHVAIAVGKENFMPYVEPCIAQAEQGLQFDSTELHEYSYTFFANLAKVLEEDMGAHVERLVPHLLKEIQESDGSPLDAEDDEEEETPFADDDDDDEFAGAYTNIRTSVLDKKKAALVAVGSLAEHAPRAFYPHLPLAMETLTSQVDYWHGEVRAAVCSCLEWMVHVAHQASGWTRVFPPAQEWERGQPTPLPQVTAGVCAKVVELLLHFMANDHDSQVVAVACAGLKGVVEMVGPSAISNDMERVMGVTNNLLLEKGACFKQDFEDEDEENRTGGVDDEDEEDDDTVDGNVAYASCDLVGAFAKVIGPSFSESFDGFLPSVMRYAKGSRPASERAMAVGCFAEVFESIGPASAKYINHALPLIKRSLVDSSAGVRRNAAFCAGTLAQGGGEAIVPYYMEILQALHPMFSLTGKGTEGGVVDNAAAAVARMIMTSPQHIPMNQVLPVFLSALPLKVDRSENEAVYTCLLGLIHMRHPEALKLLDSILAIVAKALTPEAKVQSEIQDTLVSGLRASAGEVGNQLNAAIEKLPPDLKQVLVLRLNGQ